MCEGVKGDGADRDVAAAVSLASARAEMGVAVDAECAGVDVAVCARVGRQVSARVGVKGAEEGSGAAADAGEEVVDAGEACAALRAAICMRSLARDWERAREEIWEFSDAGFSGLFRFRE